METTHYVPKIEELHVGFECEIQDTKSYSNLWKEAVVGFSPTGAGMSLCVTRYSALIIEDLYTWLRVRVKYLDQEDIEELGWEFKYEEEGNPNTMYYHGAHSLIHSPNNRILITMRDEERKLDHTAFVGTCKNKSKLKILMEDIGI